MLRACMLKQVGESYVESLFASKRERHMLKAYLLGLEQVLSIKMKLRIEGSHLRALSPMLIYLWKEKNNYLLFDTMKRWSLTKIFVFISAGTYVVFTR